MESSVRDYRRGHPGVKAPLPARPPYNGLAMPGQTMLDKIWARHVVATGAGGRDLLYVDRHLVHEGSFHAFEMLRRPGDAVRRPDLTRRRRRPLRADRARQPRRPRPRSSGKVEELGRNAAEWGIALPRARGSAPGHRPRDRPRAGPDAARRHARLRRLPHRDARRARRARLRHRRLRGRARAGHADALAARPQAMRITVDGRPARGVAAKDVDPRHHRRASAPAAAPATCIEYAGAAIRALSMEARMTVCNMSIEAGARAGMVAPDETTFAYLAGRPLRAAGRRLGRARSREWRGLPVRRGRRASTARSTLDAAALAPMVTWGTSPEDARRSPGACPTRGERATPRGARAMRAGARLHGARRRARRCGRSGSTACSSARAPTAASRTCARRPRSPRGRRACVPAMVVPGSGLVRRAAEAEGLDRSSAMPASSGASPAARCASA